MISKCRFAPSPTGYLHVGNIRAAIINFLYAKKTGGNFYLRLDDTDIQRVKDEYRDAIIEDLAWLGLDYKEIYYQSKRLELYNDAKNKLIENGRIYPCFETVEELEIQRKIQINSGVPPLYNRASLNLSNQQKNELISSGRKPHYRFLLQNKKTSWLDKIKGDILYDGLHFSDPVLIRDNGVPTYTFCSVVDDIEMSITDIIRGEDHITNTAIQIQIFEALGGKAPDFAHLSLIKANSGKISKREGGFDIRSLRQEGYDPITIVNFLSQIGTADSVKIYSNLKELYDNFNFGKFSKSATNYDITELENLNQKVLQELEFSKVQESLNYHKLNSITQEIFNKIKSNLTLIIDLKKWENILSLNFHKERSSEDTDYLADITQFLPSDSKQDNSWQLWLEEIKKQNYRLANGELRKGKDLFLPIRFALTGLKDGPEMKVLITLFDRSEIIRRLKGLS